MAQDKTLRTWNIIGLIALLTVVLFAAWYMVREHASRESPSGRDTALATFVGREKCIECHREAYDGWLGSDHDRAMDLAGEDTVLGDFNDGVFEHNGITTRFYRREGNYYVYTEGPGGKMGEFQVTHTFGFSPLQQYLIPFPGGRLQSLTIAWDVEKKRWYHLYPENTPGPEDWLHWTRNGQNWNGMCAECHSTNLEKNYDPETDTYDTTWSEIDVGCEACHGPGSLHVSWAALSPTARPETDNFDLLVRTGGIGSREEVELCAPCHSRRTILGDYDHRGDRYLDTFLPALLREDLYYPDGQILEEVYVYGSFVQSEMYRRKVRCSNCHDPHSLKLTKEGNDLCIQCHREDAYNTWDHHFHKETFRGKPSDGWSCVKCHMPGRNYMGIDNRADHSIRIPRPDLGLLINTPDSCSMEGCHGDKPLKWSADWFTKWYGVSRKPHFGTIIDAGRRGTPEALKDLVWLAGNQLYPAIARSTALTLLGSYRGSEVVGALTGALMDDEPLVRHSAVANSDIFPPKERANLIGPLLRDDNRVVRMEAARNLAEVPPGFLTPEKKNALNVALGEYEAAMEYSLDFSFSGFNLGNLYMARGDGEKAEHYYRKAIQIDDLFYPAKGNLAMLYNRQGKNEEAEKLLLEIVQANPALYEFAYSLGLLYAEMKRPNEALTYLKAAAEGMPKRERVQYNYGLMLQQQGRLSEAEKSLTRALDLDPTNMDYLHAMADHYLKRGMPGKAREVARKMNEAHPENPLGEKILEHIESGGR